MAEATHALTPAVAGVRDGQDLSSPEALADALRASAAWSNDGREVAGADLLIKYGWHRHADFSQFLTLDDPGYPVVIEWRHLADWAAQLPPISGLKSTAAADLRRDRAMLRYACSIAGAGAEGTDGAGWSIGEIIDDLEGSGLLTDFADLIHGIAEATIGGAR